MLQIYKQRQPILAHIVERQQRVFAFIADLFSRNNVVFYPPDGGSIVIVRLPSCSSNDVAFVQELQASHGVLVTAGSFFRLQGHVRLAYLHLPEDRVREGFSLFAEFYAERAALGQREKCGSRED